MSKKKWKRKKKWKHYDILKAKEEAGKGMQKKYHVVTINWTYATEKGKQNFNKVHKNDYLFTLEQLIKFIRDTALVAEDIILIEKGKVIK